MLARPMESKRRTPLPTQQTPAPPAVLRNGSGIRDGFFVRHGNTILTVVLVASVGVLAYRWWSRSAEAGRAAVVQQIELARGSVDQLRSPGLLIGPNGLPVPPAEVVAKVRMLQTTASGLLSDVVNKADSPAVKARALVVRGDLAWAVANLPELPGAATQPTLRLDPPSDVLLGQSADAYKAALDTAGADKESASAARLGLAAVAENRGDWAAARQQLQAVADDKDGVAVLSQAARSQLAELPTFERPMYLAPPAGIELPPLPAAMGPARPSTMSTTQPTTMATTTRPTTRSVK